jgi:hypothetical protein
LFRNNLFVSCIDVTFNPRGDALLLPICDFVFEPPDGAQPQRDGIAPRPAKLGQHIT